MILQGKHHMTKPLIEGKEGKRWFDTALVGLKTTRLNIQAEKSLILSALVAIRQVEYSSWKEF